VLLIWKLWIAFLSNHCTFVCILWLWLCARILFAFWLHSDSAVAWSVCELTFVAIWQRQKQQKPSQQQQAHARSQKQTRQLFGKCHLKIFHLRPSDTCLKVNWLAELILRTKYSVVSYYYLPTWHFFKTLNKFLLVSPSFVYIKTQWKLTALTLSYSFNFSEHI